MIPSGARPQTSKPPRRTGYAAYAVLRSVVPPGGCAPFRWNERLVDGLRGGRSDSSSGEGPNIATLNVEDRATLRAATSLVAVVVLASLLIAAWPAKGAPGRGFRSRFVRVVVGDTVEVWRRGGRVGVGLIGIDAPRGNTVCGVRAAAKLQRLVDDGARFVGDRRIRFDKRLRRMFYAYAPDGGSIALRMVRSGYAYAVHQGVEWDRLREAQAAARRNRRGCLWRNGAQLATRSATTASELDSGSVSAAPTTAAAALPTGFVQGIVAGGLDLPTAFTFLPDGRILVALKGGVVRVIKNGTLLSTPLIDISDEVNDYWDRGLIGIAADPNFGTNGHVYLYYTYENNPSTYEGTKTARLTRVTVSGDTASRASETTILGSVVGNSCNAFPAGADCIPTDGPGHSTGAIHFAADGTMFVTVGEGAHWNTVVYDALRAHNLDLLAGKVLHVTRNGAGISSNPFWNGDASANRSKVWAYGVRNAYRFGLRPSDGMPFIGDVGWSKWEEVNSVPAGANLGWPCYQGPEPSGYQNKPVCKTLIAQGPSAVRMPMIAYAHDGMSSAVTGGAFYSGTSFPSPYRGAYFYGDYARDWIRYVTVGAAGNVTSGPFDFTTTGDAPVDIEMGPDGHLYYLSIYAGQLRRICYGTQSACDGDPPPTPGGSYASEVQNDDPLGYWRLAETSGTAAADASGNGRSGTYVNGPTLGAPSLLTGDPGNASASFDGTNDHVSIPHAAVWDLTGDLTLEALINVTGGSSHRTIVAKHLASTNTPTFEFRVAASTGKLEFVQKTTSGTFRTLTSNRVLATGATYHVAVTKSGTTVSLFIDGELDRSSPNFTGTIATNDRAVRIGMRDGSKPLGGRIDEVAIYDHALPLSRVRAHHLARSSGGGGGNTPPSATIATPSPSLTFQVGDTITYSGSATDPEDGPLTGTSLAWNIRIQHCAALDCHVHPFLQDTGAGGSFTVPDHGDGMYFELILTATDSSGAKDTAAVEIHPQTSRITIDTVPSGLTVFYDDTIQSAPIVVDSVVGSTHTIEAPNQAGWTFGSWSDGGAQSHTIVVGTSPATYVATFSGSSSGTYRDEVLTDAPLGYWRLGESSGTTAADASGNARPGAYVNTPTLGSPGLLTGEANTSVTFDGITEHVSIPEAPVWNLTGDLTIEALINVTGGHNYRTIVSKHRATDDTSTFELRIEASTGRLQFIQKTTAGTYMTASAPTPLSTGTTYHVAVTKAGTTVRLYINGVLDRTATFSSPVAANVSPVRIAIRDGQKAFGGRIDEVAIYDHALSAARIGAHAGAR